MEFGWGIVYSDRPVNLSGRPPFTAQKNAKLNIFGKSCFTNSNFLNGSTDATACIEMSRRLTRSNSILIGQAV